MKKHKRKCKSTLLAVPYILMGLLFLGAVMFINNAHALSDSHRAQIMSLDPPCRHKVLKLLIEDGYLTPEQAQELQ